MTERSWSDELEVRRAKLVEDAEVLRPFLDQAFGGDPKEIADALNKMAESGGAFAHLPHVARTIDGLREEARLVERAASISLMMDGIREANPRAKRMLDAGKTVLWNDLLSVGPLRRGALKNNYRDYVIARLRHLWKSAGQPLQISGREASDFVGQEPPFFNFVSLSLKQLGYTRRLSPRTLRLVLQRAPNRP
jgi:hypothetical protein